MGVHMARRRNPRAKNFGFGNQILYAAKMALHEYYGGGHFATVDAHLERFSLFCDWLYECCNIRDARAVTKELFVEYALYLGFLLVEDEVEVSTATNRVSSVNVVLEIMREDQVVRIDKIAEALGEKRSYIRRSIPDGMDYQEVMKLHSRLVAEGFPRAAAIVLLARTTGMRLRECILADLPRLYREAILYNRINVQNGCKGGRSGAFAPRWISISDGIVFALDYAVSVSPSGSVNLLDPSESYTRFIYREVNPSRKIMKLLGVKGPHELRAAFACQRYQELVGIPAPVFPRPSGDGTVDAELVRAARQIVSRELGHERLSVTNSYLGSETR
ncbi:integrase [Pseudomonas aeruginosa]|uniref:integrase n=1 Tax=Pseudomonas aeruginosa TaxID=287 RepID=UPI000F51DAB6|nr:integrase [Pseudomonas aeruginosa]MCO2025814.1 integrase [Pseudomonas aeruginosa]MCS7675687.1 integrase [Pseudomonas aeruginosa]MCS7904994.1 integrase [Pseudomonas aeruginosa]MCS9345757.1 integrase [Pseudomonas aeruginosa]MCS9358596.1 integrase [Pseudomonas aeruginosa]